MMPIRLPRAWPRLGVATLIAAASAAMGCQPAVKDLPPREFERQWQELVARRRFTAADSVISARSRRLPDDAEVFVARGNLYMRMAQGGPADAAGPRPPAKSAAPQGNAAASASDSGAATTGVAPEAVTVDSLLVRRAIDALSEGIRRHPERLDMRFGLAYVLQAVGRPSAQVEVLTAAVEYARQRPETLRWAYGDPLPSPPEEYVPRTLHQYVRFYLERGAPEDERPMLALATLGIDAYPKAPYLLNDVAYHYASLGDWRTSLKYLLRAEHADSTDALVLYNIGWAHENLGDRGDAVRYYRRSLVAAEAGGADDLAESNRQRIGELTGRTP